MPSNIKTPTLHRPSSYFHETITSEPDLGDQRRSTFKALPSPSYSSNRAMYRLRLSALLILALSTVSFMLTLLITLAGRRAGYLGDEYMLRLNASHVGSDLIRFSRASSTTSASPSAATTSPSNPLDALNPFSTASPLNPSNADNPLNQLTSSLEPALGNLTDSIDNGLGDALNQLVKGLIEEAGFKDFYYMYTSTICEGDVANGTGGNKDGVKIERCTSYDDASEDLGMLLPYIQSSVVIAQTNISVPIIAELMHSIGTLSSGVALIRRALLAFLIISMIGSGVSTILALPSVFFPASRPLIYVNLSFSQIAAFAAFIVAILLTSLIKAVASAVGGLGDALSLFVGEGSSVITFAWVSWASVLVVGGYWAAVWFVEIRGWAFVRRQRRNDEMGNWKGIVREVRRDVKG